MNQRILIIGIVIIALLLVAHGLLLNGIRRQRLDRSAMATQIAPLEQAMEEEQEDVPLLITRQAEYEASQATFQALETALPSEADTAGVLSEVFRQETIHAVEVTRIKARSTSTLTVGEIAYRVLGYDLTAKGELDALAGFIQSLETGAISSTMLSQITVAMQPTPSSDQPAPAFEAQIVLKIYTRPLSSGEVGDVATTPFVSTEERVQELQMLLQQAQQETEWERSIDLLLILRQLEPENETWDVQLVEAYVNAGEQQLAEGEYPEASQSFRAALVLDPDNAAAQIGLTQLQLLTPTTTATVTQTPTPSPTPSPSLTPTPSATPMPYFVSRLERTANTRYEDLGCDWFGFYGKITDVNGYPVSGINVHVWAEDWVGVTTTTSSSGEYEIYLDDHPR